MPADTPRPSLTRDRIVAAAIRRADREGMERLSMRALAGDLGVEAMSRYNHVRNKEDLIDGMVEAVLGDVARPPARALGMIGRARCGPGRKPCGRSSPRTPGHQRWFRATSIWAQRRWR